jgi:TRAP-type C4-dicarboxylate transport system permease small subunit
MPRFLSIVKRSYIGLCIGLNYIAVAVVFLMSLWICADVVGRYFFSHPIAGTTELVKAMIIIIVFLSVPFTWQQGRHIRTTLILDRLSPRKRTGLEILIGLLALGVFASICIFSWDAAWESWSLREFDGDQLRVPVYPSRFIVMIGAGLLVIQLTVELVNHVKALAKKP